MSFLDLATLATHRRSEMEERINILTSKCDQAQSNLRRLKLQAGRFVERLNCEPTQLKDRFLDSMKHLDEFIYLVTDFNLAVGKLEETATQEQLPVQDVASKQLMPIILNPPHLLDVLSEPTPSTSTACANQCPNTKTKPKHKKLPKEDVLIQFSSTSCSQESVPERGDKLEIAMPTEIVNNLSLQASVPSPLEKCNLPAQSVLDTEVVYNGGIMHIDGTSIWVITDNLTEARELMLVMRDHYQDSHVRLSKEQLQALTYCAFYDEESDGWYRALFLKLIEDHDMAELFLMDTGEVLLAPVGMIRPLARQFCVKPPYARCCHLAGVDMLEHNEKRLLEKQEEFLKGFRGENCRIQVDDNTSESLGVYIGLETNELLNELIVKEGLAVPKTFCDLEEPAPSTEVSGGKREVRAEVQRAPAEVLDDDDFKLDDGPEFEDPLEAVTGYHNRDEAEICKHYKGGADKTCFKGARCKKKHIRMHPGGWTLDKVEVVGKPKSLPLPAPGTWHKARVTYVGHFDHVFVQFVINEVEEHKRTFGVVLPPTTLASLVRDMNSPAARVAHRPLKFAPAPGELVAALYPLDNQWYRATVLSLTNHDQCVEVQYVDYGNELWVKENNIRELDPAYTVLPFQAVKCKLAGVVAKTTLTEQWVRAKQALRDLVQDRVLNLLVIACHYDELEIELYDVDEYSVAEKLAAQGEVDLRDVVVQESGGEPAQQIVVHVQ